MIRMWIPERVREAMVNYEDWSWRNSGERERSLPKPEGLGQSCPSQSSQPERTITNVTLTSRLSHKRSRAAAWVLGTHSPWSPEPPGKSDSPEAAKPEAHGRDTRVFWLPALAEVPTTASINCQAHK